MKILLTVLSLAMMAMPAGADITQSPHGKLQWECYDCHNTTSWTSIKKPLTFQHEKTGFPLIGAHEAVACMGCHKDLKFARIGTACADCHTDIHRAQFGSDCDRCHSPKNWANNNDITTLHASRGFPLLGVHEIADCRACHIGQEQTEFSATPVDCRSCHADNFAKATDPNHIQAKFSGDCQDCHQPVASSWKNASYQHTPVFTLHGRHATINCNSCHAQGYSNVSSDCYNCHQADFAATTEPAHATFGFPTVCLACHNDISWNEAQFDHLQASQFALSGAHATILCTACHIDNQLTDLPLECYGCHQNDFTRVSNPDHFNGNFPQTCLLCHTEEAWSPATFNHNQSQFPLTGAHTALQCQACHAGGYQNTPFDCYSCHESNFNGATEPSHVQNNFDHNCLACHSTSAWQPASFDHSNTNFPLTGAHISLQCINCHSAGYQNTPTDCYDCHQADFNGAGDPNHVQNDFSHDCRSCHSTTGWSPATFDHANTQFPLTGAHVSLQCIACHAAGYQNTPTDCYSCHLTDFNGAGDPNHVQNDFSHDCRSCHSTTGWSPATFDHANTRFPLTGAHVSLQCIACHAAGYQNTPYDCYSCHADDYNNTRDPDHSANGFSHDCTQCHSTSSWEGDFNHSNLGFPLTGAHATIQCIACHADGYQNTPSDCYSCHQDDYNGVTDPNHAQNNFDHDCTGCHSTTGWSPATFDHGTTQFPLTGAHAAIQCIACHAGGYQNTPSDCYSCHQDDYNGVIDPNHVQNNFDHDCTGCHSTTGWSPATFDHSTTQFPLTGAHISVQCQACHAGGYQNTPTDCYSCHQSAYEGVSDPSHVQNNFDHNCTLCHSTAGWSPATFDHSNTHFPLTGAHVSLQCLACHAGGYQNTPYDCYSCHQSDYERVTDPNHVVNNFSHDCTECHNTSSWDDGAFDHSGTRFPLTGAHVNLQCTACHADGYQNTPYDCYSCHQSNYEGVADPNHIQDNFSHICIQCHNTSNWTQVAFDHNLTPFPLTGAHLTTSCQSCHAGGYDNTSGECYDCHRADYNNTTNPNHQSAGFPTLCQSCHSTTAWVPSTWNHDALYFPIFSGRHQGRWTACVDCHLNPDDYSTFECIFCHEHNQPDTDSHHTDVPSYQYNSPACYACHPRGEGEGRLRIR